MLQPFDSMAFLCDNVWKRINNLKCGQRSGRGFAVPLQNLGISNGMRQIPSKSQRGLTPPLTVSSKFTARFPRYKEEMPLN